MMRRQRSGGLARRSSGGSGKKLTIKTKKAPPKLPEDFEEKSWKRLREAVSAVFAEEPVTASREELYRTVQDMCSHRLAASLFSRLEKELDGHVKTVVDRLSPEAPTVGLEADASSDVPVVFPEDGVFMDAVCAVWETLSRHIVAVRSIFLFLDRTYVLQATQHRSLWHLAVKQLRGHMDAHPAIAAGVVRGVLGEVTRERDGQTVDVGRLRTLTRLLLAVRLYAPEFEERLVAVSRAYYAREGARRVRDGDVAQYLRGVDQRLREEAARAGAYLHAGSRQALARAVEDELLREHVEALVRDGFPEMMGAGRVEDVRRLHRLLARVGATDRVRAALVRYVVETGKALVQAEGKEKEMVAGLLGLKSRVDAALKEAFGGANSFHLASKAAFEEAVNSRDNVPAEMLAKFVDGHLRSGTKGLSDSDVERVLDEAMALFRFLNAKDVFEAFYKKDLAKRLLLKKSASEDRERAMLQKLKNECGPAFTAKLEGMFSDIDLSKGLASEFGESEPYKEIVREGVSLDVHILTSSHWPAYPPRPLELPAAMKRYQGVFKAFYATRFTGRKLAWQHGLGVCVLKANFPRGVKELSVSLFQAVALMQFNRTRKLSTKALAEASGIELDELKRTLQSLACGKVRVLKKGNTSTAAVADDEEFRVNEKFTAKLRRLKVNAVQLKETKKEKEAVNKDIQRQRQYETDAAIVRVMKSRKRLKHQDLLTEVFKQVRFPAQASDVKRRIESLIEREYLERDEEEAGMYAYLA